MALSGVRSSWLMEAKKRSLASVLQRSSSLARSSSPPALGQRAVQARVADGDRRVPGQRERQAHVARAGWYARR
jgi:hypothetical protein